MDFFVVVDVFFFVDDFLVVADDFFAVVVVFFWAVDFFAVATGFFAAVVVFFVCEYVGKARSIAVMRIMSRRIATFLIVYRTNQKILFSRIYLTEW